MVCVVLLCLFLIGLWFCHFPKRVLVHIRIKREVGAVKVYCHVYRALGNNKKIDNYSVYRRLSNNIIYFSIYPVIKWVG